MSRRDWIARYTDGVVRGRWAIVVATVLFVLATSSGARLLEFRSSYEVFFGPQNPFFRAYASLQEIYSKSDNLLIAIVPRSGDVFTPEVLGIVRELTEAGWQLPFATRVDSIANFQHTRADGDDLHVGDLVPTVEDLSPADLREIREIALSEPMLRDQLVRADATATAVNVSFHPPSDGSEEIVEIISGVRELVGGLRERYPDIQFAITGIVALNAAFVEVSLHDLGTIVPLMYGTLILVTLALLRSVSGTLSTLLVIGFSVGTAMGLSGWVGWTLDPVVVTAPTIILTIGIADSIHILVIFLRELRGGMSRRDAIEETLRVNWQPVFLTSLTTVIGFLALNTSEVPPFRQLGNMTAIGVTAAWIYSVLFLPAMLAILPFSAASRGGDFTFGMAPLAETVLRHRWKLTTGMLGAFVLSAALVPRIELNDHFVQFFDESLEFRRDADFIAERLTGVFQVEYSMRSGEPGGIADPDYLRNLDRFVGWLREQPGVRHVSSLTHVMKRLNESLHGGDPEWRRLPEERDLAAQYLLLYEMSLPYGLDLNNQIDVDKSATRVVATLDNVSAARLRSIREDSERWLRENLPETMHADATGSPILFAYISIRNVKSMIASTLIALALIALALGVALRSAKFGLVSIVPNVLPATIALGIWAVLVGEAGMSAAPVVPTSLGIIVDFTVHFLSKYLRARRTRSLGPEDAVRYAFSSVGAAVLVTSLILVAGFSILALSTFHVNGTLGLLTALTIGAAILADFLLLPPLLLAIDKETPDESNRASGPLAA